MEREVNQINVIPLVDVMLVLLAIIEPDQGMGV